MSSLTEREATRLITAEEKGSSSLEIRTGLLAKSLSFNAISD